MKFGVREICDVVFKAKSTMTVGNRTFFKDEPVIYFDSLKTSTLEGAATTVYAQGGKGNTRLIAWEGERTLTFTMEDALISPIGFSILSGAGLIEATDEAKIKVHATETTTAKVADGGGVTITLEEEAAAGTTAYVMILANGEVTSEPYVVEVSAASKTLTIKTDDDTDKFTNGGAVLVDYYVERGLGATQIEITADKFGGNFYVEASTLFRDTNGVDMPAEFIIPNAKVQSNFTFTMASSGDPSTFTFTMDAFPGELRYGTAGKKVLAAIQIIAAAGTNVVGRDKTDTKRYVNDNGIVLEEDGSIAKDTAATTEE